MLQTVQCFVHIHMLRLRRKELFILLRILLEANHHMQLFFFCKKLTTPIWSLSCWRFTYCVLASLHLLGQPIRRQQNISNYIARCQNDDGGFGMSPGSESHGGQTFCCIASLSLCDALELVDLERLHEWLLERQDSSGGFNGRPGKTCDACYAWWIGASLCIIG